jgi:hypothetical protein
LKPKKKKNKSKPTAKLLSETAPVIISADTRERNEISRVKIERDIKQYRKTAHLDDVPKSDKNWPFDYSLDHSKSNIKKGAYHDVMAGLLDSADLKMSGILLSKPISTDVTIIPNTRTTDEIIDILKHAMIKVSKRLVDFQRANDLKKVKDNDLDELDTTTLNFLNIAEKGTEDQYLYSDNPFKNDDEIERGSVDSDEDASGENLDDGDDESDDERNSDRNVSSPPAFDDALLMPKLPEDQQDSDNDEETVQTREPPTYEEILVKKSTLIATNLTSHNNLSRIPVKNDEEISYDNIGLIFQAFLELSNDANWLGKVSKLTRLKFMGGIESILKIRMSWGQFGALW